MALLERVPQMAPAATSSAEAPAPIAPVAIEETGYVGAAPVTLAAYVNRVRAQTIGSLQVTFDEIRKALTHLVLPEKTLRQLGPAINSGRSIFLFGPPGTGKSSIAETLATML